MFSKSFRGKSVLLVIISFFNFYEISCLTFVQKFVQIQNKDFPENFTSSRFKYYSIGAYSGQDFVSSSLNYCAQECDENEFCFMFKYIDNECLTFRKVCQILLIDSPDSTLYAKEIDSNSEHSILVTRDYSPLDAIGSFSQAISTNGINRLVSIKMFYTDGFCVSGFTFVYSDNTAVETGFKSEDETTYLNIDLNMKKIYSINSWCGWICDRIEICTVDLITAQRVCFDAGNRSSLTSLTMITLDENNDTEHPNIDNTNTEDYCISGFYGDYADYYGNCVRKFGIKYFN